jgi:hypothetical protein
MNWIGVQGGGGLQFFLDLQMMPVRARAVLERQRKRDGSPLEYREYKSKQSTSFALALFGHLLLSQKIRRPRL